MRHGVAYLVKSTPRPSPARWWLAIAYQNLGQLDEAETLINETLEIQRRDPGPQHPDTLTSMDALADLYSEQCRLAESESIRKETLEIRRRTLSPTHVDSLLNMVKLADVYSSQERFDEAEDFGQTLWKAIASP